jgi:hypothetical protein
MSASKTRKRPPNGERMTYDRPQLLGHATWRAGFLCARSETGGSLGEFWHLNDAISTVCGAAHNRGGAGGAS